MFKRGDRIIFLYTEGNDGDLTIGKEYKCLTNVNGIGTIDLINDDKLRQTKYARKFMLYNEWIWKKQLNELIDE